MDYYLITVSSKKGSSKEKEESRSVLENIIGGIVKKVTDSLWYITKNSTRADYEALYEIAVVRSLNIKKRKEIREHFTSRGKNIEFYLVKKLSS